MFSSTCDANRVRGIRNRRQIQFHRSKICQVLEPVYLKRTRVISVTRAPGTPRPRLFSSMFVERIADAGSFSNDCPKRRDADCDKRIKASECRGASEDLCSVWCIQRVQPKLKPKQCGSKTGFALPKTQKMTSMFIRDNGNAVTNRIKWPFARLRIQRTKLDENWWETSWQSPRYTNLYTKLRTLEIQDADSRRW